MDSKIAAFLKKQHILSLCVSTDGDDADIWAASCFYAFDEQNIELIIASSDSTKHIKMATQNPKVAVNIALNTKIIGIIKGVQASGILRLSGDGDERSKGLYFKRFAYAKILNPQIYIVALDFVKYTDNALGFGSKMQWRRS